MKDMVGKTFGEYRLVKHIGSGGMADVYLAEQTTLKRFAAVKILRPAVMELSGERIVSRFRHEAMTAAALDHPNIVQVYTIGEQDGYHFIAQEYVRGNDLASILKTQGTPVLAAALQIVKQMATALAAAGKAGIIHRDIKPDNVLVNVDGIVKIADFGLAQLQGMTGDGRLTQEGKTLGTPLYMSPEQVRGEDLDQRSDIYSLGITCYQILSGRTPFSGKTATAIAVQHVTTKAPLLSEEKFDLPDVVCRMIHCMMAKQRSHRYRTADEIVTDVEVLQTAMKQRRSLDLVRLPELSRIEKQLAHQAAIADAKTTLLSEKTVEDRKRPAASDLRPERPRQLSRKRVAAEVLGDRPWVSLPSWNESEDDDIGIGRHRPDFETMDLTPMVDVTFLLLIFFMITAAFDLQKKFDVNAAQNEDAVSVVVPNDEHRSVEVEIAHNNVVYIGDENAETYHEILHGLEAARERNPELELQLRIDPKSRYEMRIRVNDAAVQAGFIRIRSVHGSVERQ